MKKPFMFRTIIFCACVLSNWANAVGQTAPNQETFIAAPQVHLRMLSVNGVGVEFSKPSFKTDYGRGVSLVSFTAKNTSAAELANLRLSLYVVNDFNTISGGQTWCAAGKLDPGQVREYTAYVQQAFPFDTGVLVTLRHATSAESRLAFQAG